MRPGPPSTLSILTRWRTPAADRRGSARAEWIRAGDIEPTDDDGPRVPKPRFALRTILNASDDKGRARRSRS